MAYEKELDLVLINENSRPPITRLMDYGKYVYTQTKSINKQKAKSHGGEIKEIRFSIKIGEHDLQVKINQIKRFFEHGDKVKITVQLKGREMMFRDRVAGLMEKIKQETGGTYEKSVEKMGTRFFATLTKGSNEIKNT